MIYFVCIDLKFKDIKNKHKKTAKKICTDKKMYVTLHCQKRDHRDKQ